VSDFLISQPSVYTAAPRANDSSWQDRALCPQTDPEAFFPEKGGSTKEGKRVCHDCPVRHECLFTALAANERFGIWGGLSERERRRLLVLIIRDDFDELYIQAQRLDLDLDVVVNWCADPDLRARLLELVVDVAATDDTADQTVAIACGYDTPAIERLAG
jgi:WhiB family transcriptional regulator, redox-sensing transcriptional regulator